VWSMYKVWAMVALPRLSASKMTSTMCSPPGVLISSLSPIRSSLEALVEWPASLICPAEQAVEARERVLKNREAQSHLSIRTAWRGAGGIGAAIAFFGVFVASEIGLQEKSLQAGHRWGAKR